MHTRTKRARAHILLRRAYFKKHIYVILLFALYKIHFFCIFFQKNLHISDFFCTFAMSIKKRIKIVNHNRD